MDENDFPADQEIDAVLVEQLGALGTLSAFGGGALGARWTAKRLKTETDHIVLDIPAGESDRIIAEVDRFLDTQWPDEQCAQSARDGTGHGSDRQNSGGPDSGGAEEESAVSRRGIVASGFGSMNPAYVIIVIDRHASTIGIAAHAKEGLIKQRTAQKAVGKVRQAISL